MNPALRHSAQRTLDTATLMGLSPLAMQTSTLPTRPRNDPTINHSTGGNLAGTPFHKPGMP